MLPQSGDTPEPEVFSGASLEEFGTYPPRVRQALRQAHYYEQLASLARTAVDLTDPNDLLQRAPLLVTQALGCDGALVFLVESNHRDIRIASTHGGITGFVAGERLSRDSDPAVAQVLQTHDVVLVADGSKDERRVELHRARPQELQSSLSVPLFDQGKVVGVLSAVSTQRQYFADDEVRFMQAVASVLATGLQRAQIESQLRQAHKMESVGKLTGGIAHDFNNLLTVIQGSLQMAQEIAQGRSDGRLQDLLQAATGASRRAADLTGKLLAFSRRQMLTPSRVELDELLPSLVDLLRRTLGEKIAIVVDVASDCPPCVVDRVQLESALLNIAINARDAMPEGGELVFTCAGFTGLPAELFDAPAGHSTDGLSSWVCISITDTGSGMSSDVRDSAFEPFFTTKDAGRGTGLGLSSVYGFVQQSRGSITLDSMPGLGTTVTMLLPAVGGDVQAEAVLRPAASKAPPKGLRVLLVEDDAEVRYVAQQFLESLQCRVSTHASAESAWLELEQGTVFDLLMTDIELGSGIKGTEFARRAKVLRPNLPVLLSSGYSNYLTDERREEPGRWPLLKKPFSKEELAAAVAATVSGAG